MTGSLRPTSADGEVFARSVLGIGIDIADTARFEQLVRRYGQRFTQRWFTDAEVARCQAPGADGFRSYALCFAAKEAVWKALRLDGTQTQVPWRMITILLADDRRTATVRLSDDLLERSERLGVCSISTSLCAHNDVSLAMAIVETSNRHSEDSSEIDSVDVVGAFGVEGIGELVICHRQCAVFADDFHGGAGDGGGQREGA